MAAALRGFGPVGVISLLAILLTGNMAVAGVPFVPIGATLALVWAWRSRTPWRALGLARPRTWFGTLTVGLILGSTLKVFMKAVIMPLLGAPPVNQAYQFLTGNQDLLPLAVWAMFVAGFSEETVFRGFLFERARTLFGGGRTVTLGIVLLTSLWFGLEHYGNQQVPGVQQAVIVGLIFGTIFVRTGNLWMLIVAHTAFDLTALAMIYWGVEADVARLFFKSL